MESGSLLHYSARHGNKLMTVIRLMNHATRLAVFFGLLQLVSCAYQPRFAVDEELSAMPTSVDASANDFSSFPSAISAESQATAAMLPPVWQHFSLPGKQATRYVYRRTDGRHAIKATARSSASMLRQSVRVNSRKAKRINFSWKVPRLIPGADLTQRETHDSPVRIVLAFEGDRSKFSAKNSMLSELAHTLTGEPMPYATLMYVWCNACAPEAGFINPRTDRIREIAMESGPANLGRWMDYQRDIVADFEKVFGEAPGALIGVGIMTDADNTRQDADAWYGPIFLSQ